MRKASNVGQKKMATTKYQHLVAWGKMMGSYDYYILSQIAEAEATNAPEDAIFERDGVWSTFKDCCVETQVILKRALGQ